MMMRAKVIRLLAERGVTLEDIGALVYEVQQKYHPGLTVEECTRCVYQVLKKREVQNVFLTGIALDMLTERRMLPEPLQGMLERDEPLYGVDEIMALGITNIYGSIGLTNFGFLDRQKIGILHNLDQEEKTDKRCHTFLDDLLAGLAAAAAAKLAHGRGRRRRGGGRDGAPPGASANGRTAYAKPVAAGAKPASANGRAALAGSRPVPVAAADDR